MTRLVRFSNNAVSNLAANLTTSGTSLSVTSGDGAKFPAISAGQYFMATIVKADGSTEVVKVTARSTDTMTIVRTAEPVGGASVAYAFSAGDRIEARLTAGVLSDEIDRLDNGAVVEAVNKSANYTLVEADVTKLVRVTTTAGTTTITLPATSALTDDYDVIVAKVTSDVNTVVIARTGSTDLINGATSYTIYNQWQSAWLIADRSTNTWTVISSGISAVNTVVDAGTGSGSASVTLSGDPGSINNTAFFVGGVYQQKSTYSISGTTLTAGGAIASGVGYEVVWSAPLTVGTPSDGTVTTAKLAALAVTTAKLADANVTTAKLADANVTSAKLSTDAQFMGFKNRIINGAMMIDQRNAGASINVASALVFPVDRVQVVVNAASGSTAQRSTQAPAGFTNSLAVTIGTGASPTAAQQGRILQPIEGFNCADLAWGTASAVPVTISFWVRSSVTGTYAGGLYGGGAAYIFTYAISAANTWEYKTATIPGPTTGSWPTDNAASINVNFDLGTGSNYQGTAGSWTTSALWSTPSSVKLCATSGATFYITGVQLEKGSTATSFDLRPYGTELALCQRYLPAFNLTSGQTLCVGAASGSTNIYGVVAFPVSARVAPTGITFSGSLTAYNGVALTASSVVFGNSGPNSAYIQLTVSGATAGQASMVQTSSATQLLFNGCEL